MYLTTPPMTSEVEVMFFAIAIAIDVIFVAFAVDVRFVAIAVDVRFVAVAEDVLFAAIAVDVMFVNVAADVPFVVVLLVPWWLMGLGMMGMKAVAKGMRWSGRISLDF